MTTAAATPVSRLLPGSGFVVTAGAMVLAWALEQGNAPYTANFRGPADVLLALAVLGVASAGVVVLVDRRRHLTGRLALLFGAGFATAVLANAVAVRVLLVGDGPEPLGRLAAGITSFAVLASFALLPFLLVTWPAGRVDTPWLRRLTPCAVAVLAVTTAAQATSPGRLDGVAAPYSLSNPFGVGRLETATDVTTTVGVGLLVLFGLVVVGDLLLRARRAVGERRRTLMPVAMTVAGLPLAAALSALLVEDDGWVYVLLVTALLGVPTAIGLAVRGTRRRERMEAERAALIEEREDERRRLRQELHDGVGPMLAALRLELDAVTGGAEGDRARALVADSITEVRRISRGLRPALLDELGLVRALAHRAGTLSGGVAWSVEIPPAIVLPAGAEVAVFHIASEAMTNVVRHSGAGAGWLRLEVGDGVVRVEVADDGRGTSRPVPGVGLRSMRARAAQLGGSVELLPRPGGGTRVVAVIPAGAS